MTPTGFHFASVLGSFLLAISALFSIVNPIGAALIFHEVTSGLSHEDRARIASRVGMYSLAVLLVSLWLGASVISFFGITLGALRIAGGLVVATRAWSLLNAPEVQEARKTEQATSSPRRMDEAAFYPLTMPFTTGPGTIAVAIALGSERPADRAGLIAFSIGVTAAAAVVALIVLIVYRFADVVIGRMGRSASRIVTRLSAFLLLCIGVQIMINGVEEVFDPLLKMAGASR